MSKAMEVEQQFARQFVATDWTLFKRMADANFSEAAHLRTADVRAPHVGRLRARNIRKRLLIGVGAELLLKASFLKAGFAINLPLKGSALTFPSEFAVVGTAQLHQTKTASFKQCLDNLHKAMQPEDERATRDGLEIAQVFRNKEAHGVIERHPYHADTYRTIEASLIAVYRDAFAEDLSVTIAMTAHDKVVWRVKGRTR